MQVIRSHLSADTCSISPRAKSTLRMVVLSFFVVLAWAIPVRAGYERRCEPYAPDEIIVKFKGPAADMLTQQTKAGRSIGQAKLSDELNALNADFGLKRIGRLCPDSNRGRRAGKLPKTQSDSPLAAQKHRTRQAPPRSAGERPIELGRLYKLELDLKGGKSVHDAVAAYSKCVDVEYAELNYTFSIYTEPNDPLYPLQWALNNTGQMYPASGGYNDPPGTADADVDAPEAWQIEAGDSNVVVAIIDTGVDYSHRDLEHNMWINADEVPGNGIDDDNNGYIDDIFGYDFVGYIQTGGDGDPRDDNGHGTHCAGIAAADGNNGLDISGLCRQAGIMAVKFLDADGSGYSADAVAAIYYAVANDARVISNSWGGGSYSKALEEAIAYAASMDVIVVAAAGNDNWDIPQYPAYYEGVIAVAATNSNDQKAPFSNFGDWVDIAAPGVDILSLLADGTGAGTIYDDYTTVASGTSMACPHVAGASALLLSVNPTLTPTEVYEVLAEGTDAISPGICTSGRLNLFNSAKLMHGHMALDRDYYMCSDLVRICLLDSGRIGGGTLQMIAATSGGDLEAVTLTELDGGTGVFAGQIATTAETVAPGNGLLEVAHDQAITVTYQDNDDGLGSPQNLVASAVIDCQPPTVASVEIDPFGQEPTVTFATDEQTAGKVHFGRRRWKLHHTVGDTNSASVEHTIILEPVLPETRYYFVVEAADLAGNVTVDDNSGKYYRLTTDGPGPIYVPYDYNTIQEAIYHSWDGGTVWVADGSYTENGNRDIDFRARAITVTSINGPEYCVIDCNADQEQQHRGFVFDSGEQAESILQGFTIINGYALRGGAVWCTYSSPTIKNCLFTANNTEFLGGAISNFESNPIIANCAFTDNHAEGYGGGIDNDINSSPEIVNCTFSNNTADYGGAITNFYQCDATIIDCNFEDNTSQREGGAVDNIYSSPTISKSSFTGNSSAIGGAAASVIASDPHITNCRFSSNSAGIYGGAIYTEYRCNPVISNCLLAGNAAYVGGTIYNRTSKSSVINCTLTGNSAILTTGGIISSQTSTTQSEITVSNCIFWNNSDISGTDQQAQLFVPSGSVLANYNCIQGWTGLLGGVGNFGDDPCFVEAGYYDPCNIWVDGDYHLLRGSPCIDSGNSAAVASDITDLDGDGDTNEPLPYDLERNARFADKPNSPDAGYGPWPIVDMGVYEAAPEPIELPMRLMPRFITVHGKARWLWAFLRLRGGITADDIDLNTPAYTEPLNIKSRWVRTFGQPGGWGYLIVGFSKAELAALADNGRIELKVYAFLKTGQKIYGSDTVVVRK